MSTVYNLKVRNHVVFGVDYKMHVHRTLHFMNIGYGYCNIELYAQVKPILRHVILCDDLYNNVQVGKMFTRQRMSKHNKFNTDVDG